MEKKWLDDIVTLDSKILHSIFDSYFNQHHISTSLDNVELDNVSCLFIRKLLNDKDCQTSKKREISYRDIFEILLEVFDSLKPDDIDLTTECYELTLHFYNQISGNRKLYL